MVVALYATLKAGSAYVPIDPEYPADRVSFMLDDTRSPDPADAGCARRALLPTRLLESIPVDLDRGQLADRAAANPSARATLDDLAYVIYTSGSTGQPKGAMITHRAIANRIHWMQDAYALTADDRVLQKTPFSFDVSVWEFFWPLLFGAELVIAEPGGHRDSAYLAQVIVERGITTIHFVPSMLQLFLEDPRAGRLHEPQAGHLQRRGAAEGSPGPVLRAARRRAAQPVRPDRGCGRRHRLGL